MQHDEKSGTKGSLQPRALAYWPGYLMKYVFEGWYERYQTLLRELDLSVNGFIVLITLQSEGSAPQAKLVERLGIDRSTMVQIVDELETAGFVERRRDGVDRRVVPLYVTPAGALTAAEGARLTDESNQAMFSGFSEHEQRKFVEGLSQLADAIAKDAVAS